MSDFDPGADVGPPTVSRRTVVRGAAWSVPVVMVAAAAPAFAASALASATSPGAGCHVNTSPPKSLRAFITFTGPNGTLVSVSGVATSSASATNLPVSGTITSGQWIAEIHLTTPAGNEFFGRTLTVTYTANAQPQPTASVVIPSFTSTC